MLVARVEPSAVRRIAERGEERTALHLGGEALFLLALPLPGMTRVAPFAQSSWEEMWLASFERSVRNASISRGPRPAGCRFPWKMMKRRTHAT